MLRGNPQRASRLPEDWKIPEDWIEWTLKFRPDWTRAGVIRASLGFRDYWCARSGREAVKTNWLATWRNRIRALEAEPTR